MYPGTSWYHYLLSDLYFLQYISHHISTFCLNFATYSPGLFCAAGRDRASSGCPYLAQLWCLASLETPMETYDVLLIMMTYDDSWWLNLWLWWLMTYDSFSCLNYMCHSLWLDSFLYGASERFTNMMPVLRCWMFKFSATQQPPNKALPLPHGLRCNDRLWSSQRDISEFKTGLDISATLEWIIQSPNSQEIYLSLSQGLESTWVPDLKGPNGGLTYGKWCHFGFQI